MLKCKLHDNGPVCRICEGVDLTYRFVQFREGYVGIAHSDDSSVRLVTAPHETYSHARVALQAEAADKAPHCTLKWFDGAYDVVSQNP